MIQILVLIENASSAAIKSALNANVKIVANGFAKALTINIVTVNFDRRLA